jgi:ligand-binding sensor domain-containing protein
MKRTWRIAPIVVGFVLAASIGLVLWEARSAFQQSAAEVAVSSELPYQIINLEPSPVAGEELLTAQSGLTDAVPYGGSLYVSSASGINVYSQDGALKKKYRVGIELPPAPVTALVIGSAGAGESELWAATSGAGLLRSSGHDFVQILPRDPSARNITALLPLSTGKLLLGTEKHGVLQFDGKHLQQAHPKFANLHVTALSGNDAEVWVGTLDRGAMRWHAGQTDWISDENGLPDKQVLSLFSTEKKTFIGTANGIAELADGKLIRTFAPGAFARTMLLQGDHLLVGTMEQGTLEVALSGSRIASVRPRGSPEPAQVDRLLTIEGKTYALAADGVYMSTQRGPGWKRVLQQDAGLLSDGNISALSIDSRGKLWVGYFDRGLDLIDLTIQKSIHTENDRVFCINRIVQDAARSVTLIATANGLVVMDAVGKIEQVLTKQDGLIADHVTDIALLPNTNGGSLSAMAIATPAGLTFFDSTGARSLYAFHGLVNNHAYTLGMSDDAADPRLMVGTLGGLSVLQAGMVRASYTTANSALKANWITALAPVSGEWFAGTYGAGVMKMNDHGTWEIFADMPNDIVVNPNAMLVTKTHVFAGTLGRGVWIFDRARQRWSEMDRGLPSLNVTALAEKDGSLFVGTDNGLARFDENRFAY